MSEWMGLHNVHKHQPISRKVAAETTQGWLCTENAPCRLCLAAEVEALRAQVQRVRDAIEAELERHTLTNLGDFMFLDQALGRILRALDGDA